MSIYVRFIIQVFLKSFLNLFLIMFSLVFILNLLSELDFFKTIKVDMYFTLYLALLNSPSLIFEMFPFIFLLSTQVFFINFFKNNELNIFKYSGLKNISIIKILSTVTFVLGIIIIILFYNLSSNFKNFYLELKSNYTSDDKYLAVITNNGLWIKDRVGNKAYIINSSKIEQNFLIDAFISEFDENYEIIRNIKSKKINIKSNKWIILNPKIFTGNLVEEKKILEIKSNFNYQRIKSLYSNLSSLSILELIELRKNYILLGYSTTEVNVHIQKLISYPIYFLLMTIFSCIIMFNSKNLKNTTFKISIGLFSSVVIYYINNFFYVLGNTERISLLISVWVPLLILGIINFIMLNKINEK
jgi:lipopolysaccharide export system permease protein